jgi:hypothetical protein
MSSWIDCEPMAPIETDQRQRSRYLEDMTARAVVAHLMSEGRTVTTYARPTIGPARSPDFLVIMDQETVAIEVVRFIDQQLAKAVGRVRSVEQALKTRLQTDAIRLGLALVLDVSFRVAPLQQYRRPDVERDADLLAADVRRALVRLPSESGEFIELQSAVPWVYYASLTSWTVPDPSFYVGSTSPEPGYPIVDAPAFVSHVIATKRDQHAGHAERAILAVRGDFDDADELILAFEAARAQLPWWRVYVVWGGGNFRVVYEQKASHELVAPR